MASLKTEAGLRTAWQAEGVFVQSMAFSLVLVTLALSFQHLSKKKSLPLQRTEAFALASALGLVALGFGCVALYGFVVRIRGLHLGQSSESGVHAAYVFLGGGLLLMEVCFMVAMLAFRRAAPAA